MMPGYRSRYQLCHGYEGQASNTTGPRLARAPQWRAPPSADTFCNRPGNAPYTPTA
jgi:hypothetical protein